jgi:hypothetical protein
MCQFIPTTANVKPKVIQEIRVMEAELLEQAATFMLEHLSQGTIEVHQFSLKYPVSVFEL